MKKIFYFLLFFILSFPLITNADTWVNGYTKANGTYVNGYYRSSPDSNPYNNYSFPGNTNPYTGKTAGGSVDSYLKNYNSSYTLPTYTSTYIPTYTPTYVPSYTPYVAPTAIYPTYYSSLDTGFSNNPAYIKADQKYTDKCRNVSYSLQPKECSQMLSNLVDLILTTYETPKKEIKKDKIEKEKIKKVEYKEVNSISVSYANKNDCANSFMTSSDQSRCRGYLNNKDKYDWKIVGYDSKNYKECGDLVYAKHLNKGKKFTCSEGVGSFK